MAFDDPFNTSNAPTDDNTPNTFYNFNDGDPAAEFLERERRELGEITGNGDTISSGDSFNSESKTTNSLTNGSHTQGGTSLNPLGSGGQYEALSQLDQHTNEPEKIRKWREEFASRITKKDTDEETKRKEMREQAKKELDDFFKQRVEQIDRRKDENRVNNRTLEDDLFNNGTNSSTTSNGKVYDWDKITSLCEFNPKTNRSQKDLTRYRSVLLQLKQQTSGK